MLAYAFALSHTAVLIRWRTLPPFFRVAALMWAVQAWNRVLWGDSALWWMPLEIITLSVVTAAAIECVWEALPGDRIFVLGLAWAIGAAWVYFAAPHTGDSLEVFLWRRAQVQGVVAFLLVTAGFVKLMDGWSMRLHTFALFAAVSAVTGSWWSTADEAAVMQAVYRVTAIACCGAWVWKGGHGERR